MSRENESNLSLPVGEEHSDEENGLSIQVYGSSENLPVIRPFSYIYDGPPDLLSITATSPFFQNIAIGFSSVTGYIILRFSFIPLSLGLQHLTRIYFRKNPTDQSTKKAQRAILIGILQLFNNAGFAMVAIADTISIFFLQKNNQCAVRDIGGFATAGLILGSLLPPLPAAIRAARMHFYENQPPESERRALRYINNGGVSFSRAVNWGSMFFSIVHAFENAIVPSETECSPPRIARYAVGLTALTLRFAASLHPKTDEFLIKNCNISLGTSFLVSTFINIIATLISRADNIDTLYISDILYIPAIITALFISVVIIKLVNKSITRQAFTPIENLDNSPKNIETTANEALQNETTPLMKK